MPGFVSNLDLWWENPTWARFFSRFAAFSRLILFDKRGTGLSDRMSGAPDLETRMDDVRAVMDAVDCERAEPRVIVHYGRNGLASIREGRGWSAAR